MAPCHTRAVQFLRRSPSPLLGPGLDQDSTQHAFPRWPDRRAGGPKIDRRRLVLTSLGFIGLIPAEAELDDKVWLVHGGNMLYILRRDGAHKQLLIGEAYMHGLMQGEHAPTYPGGLPEPETVTLR